MLATVDLECTRGERLLFAGLAFGVEAGHCLHVAGENGAGKTSLLRISAGCWRRPTARFAGAAKTSAGCARTTGRRWPTSAT